MFRSARRRNHLGRLNGKNIPFLSQGTAAAVPGDEGDAIQRAAQVSNLAGGWQLPLLEWVD